MNALDSPARLDSGPAAQASQPLMEMVGVSKRFVKPVDAVSRIGNWLGGSTTEQVVHAVDDVSLCIRSGEVVGLVGESGCGKSTLGRMVVGLHTLSSGSRRWKGMPVTTLSKEERARQSLAVQMIFQDPYASLNPRMRVVDIVGEAPVVHGLVAPSQQRDYAADMLARVGLDSGALPKFAHQFSGGQRARVGIARALAVQPELLVCDESVAALDVSIQAQVLNLFMQLRRELNLTYLFISHDLGVVQHISDRVVIMYLGRIVESAPVEQLFASPLHPYTQALLGEAPTMVAKKKTYVSIRGEIPSPLSPPSGCHFHPRCPLAMERCRTERPALRQIGIGRLAACHLA